ncbi:UpxY family transcription antiterminator [Aurantibacillus circumpalustris]|uniref:UpxY family transcription antiterminator n=1 Tax=Aurantibacillus circumpalustris TaxID=3036359 RepID=UPI00295C19A8|nr:UpxY family transcription antiterminator [Aurantibacillus circumpalustris]
MNQWKVIYVSSRAEKKVAERLQQDGIECYVPIKKELKHWSDRKKMVESPLISGYVFVKPTALQRDSVLQFQSVLQYVRYNSGDAIVRDIEIEALKSIEEKGYFVDGEFSKDLNTGDRVKIEHGPFKGLYGSVKTQAKECIYNISIEGIGYALTVKVPEEVLVKQK